MPQAVGALFGKAAAAVRRALGEIGTSVGNPGGIATWAPSCPDGPASLGEDAAGDGDSAPPIEQATSIRAAAGTAIDLIRTRGPGAPSDHGSRRPARHVGTLPGSRSR